MKLPGNGRSESVPRPGRRRLLKAIGGAVGIPVIGGTAAYASDRSYADEDGDGIPDRRERSADLHERLESLFGADQFEGLDPTRKDLLLDVRYVEGTSVAAETKANVVDLFRSNGIHAQWLDYPRTYDRAAFEADYGSNVKTALWGRESFYRTEIEPWLRNLAIQLVVVPGKEAPPHEGKVYSPWTALAGGKWDGYVNGFSVGNRAVVAERERPEEERLILHEIAHFGLCHADDPDNTGVMGTGEEIDLTDAEWAQLRSSLDNVRDTTGYDIVLRRCLWEESFADVTDVV